MTGSSADERTQAELVYDEVTDLDAVWEELKDLVIELHRYHEPLWSRRLRPDWEATYRAHISLSDDRYILVVRHQAMAIGFINAAIRRRSAGIADEDVGFIEDVYVRAEHRDSGVGHTLLARVEDWFKSAGIREVRLNVAARNSAAVRFWSTSGFEIETNQMRKLLEATP